LSKLLHYFWQLCLLRSTPQALPASVPLFYLLLLVNAVLGVLFYWQSELQPGLILLEMGSEYLFQFGMLFIALYLLGKQARFIQTANALLGANTLLALLALPFLLMVPSARLELIAALVFLFLIVWGVIVGGHILRHSFDISPYAGILLSLGLTLFTQVMLFLLFSE